MTASVHETNLNAIVEGAWTTMVIDQDDRRTFAWAAGEIERLRAENAELRDLLVNVRDRLVEVLANEMAAAAQGVDPC